MLLKFWNTASVKRSNDVTRLQALVDRKKIVISDAVICEILQLDNAEGVSLEVLNSYSSTVIERQKDFLNEFSTTMAFAVFANMRRVGKGFSGVETPLFEGMLAARQLAEEGIADKQVQADAGVADAVQENIAEDVANDAIPSPPSHEIPSPSQEQSSPPQQPQSSPQAPPQGAEFPTHIQQILDVCSALTRRVENLENDKAAQKLEIIKLKARVKSAASATISAAKPSIPAAAPTIVAAYIKRRKGVIIKDLEEELSSKTPAETPKLKDKGKGILIETPKPMKKKDQIELDA
nr:hypothetical protein [Tanacetum cinerariifolium]